MCTLLQTEWATVKKEVNGAISLDLAGGSDGGFRAYQTYLDCLVKLLTLLRRDATTTSTPLLHSGSQLIGKLPAEVVTQRRNYVKLAQQCLDRVGDLVETSPPPPGGGSAITNQTDRGSVLKTNNLSQNQKLTPDDITLLLPDVPSDAPLGAASILGNNPPPPPSLPAVPRPPSTSQNFPAVHNAVSSPNNCPNATRRDSIINAPTRGGSDSPTRPRGGTGGVRYLPSVDLAMNQKATLNMAAIRKMQEEKEIGQKTRLRMEKRLRERKKALEEDALVRFAGEDSSSSDDVVASKAKFFASASLLEQDDAVLALLRKKLATARQDENAEEEGKFIDALLNKILFKMPNHPLTESVHRHQLGIMNQLQPLITPYIRQLDSVVVPYVDPGAKSRSTRPSDVGASPTTPTTDDNSEYVAELEKLSFERQKLDILESEAIERHLDTISKDVRMAVEVIMSQLTLLYGEETFGDRTTEAAAAARESAYGVVEKVFFKPLWPLLVNMFRLGNKQDEVQLAKIMTSNMDVNPQDLGVPPHLCLIQSSTIHQRHGFEPVIAELHNLATLSSPLRKLKCLVDICKVVCHCVDDIKRANAASDEAEARSLTSTSSSGSQPGRSHATAAAGSLGADDLLPILSFVVLRSRMPQLASESRAMSEFIHESYQMGEEGYCLISLQTAIGYLMSLDDDDGF